LNVRQLVLVAVAALAVGGTAVAEVGQSGPAGQATPPPPPPPNGSVATPGTLIGTPAPAPTQAPPGRRGRRSSTPEPSPGASDTPEPPQFSTMDGVWEVQLQPLTGNGRAIYSHFNFTQKGDQITGTWTRENNQKVPFTGTFDGRLFKLNAADGKTTWTFSGYAENNSDMVGLLATADPKDKGTPFTASHRKKDRI
jgi:outer membrane protein assembly factor BamB